MKLYSAESVIDRESESPKSERTENPQEEHLTTIPKIALSPTEILNLPFWDSSFIITINRRFNPTETDIKLSNAKLILEKVVQAPFNKLEIKVNL